MYYKELSKLLGDIPHRTKGNMKVKCPKCGDSHKMKRRKDLSINYDTGMYHCHSASCDFKGTAVVFEKKLFEPKKERTDIKPFQTGPVSESGRAFLTSRGLGDDTIAKNKLAESKGWICFFVKT